MNIPIPLYTKPTNKSNDSSKKTNQVNDMLAGWILPTLILPKQIRIQEIDPKPC